MRGYIRAIVNRAKGERLVGRKALHEIDDIHDALKPSPRGRRMPVLTSLTALLDLQLAVDRSIGGLLVKLASRLLALTQVRVGFARQDSERPLGGNAFKDAVARNKRGVMREHAG